MRYDDACDVLGYCDLITTMHIRSTSGLLSGLDVSIESWWHVGAVKEKKKTFYLRRSVLAEGKPMKHNATRCWHIYWNLLAGRPPRSKTPLCIFFFFASCATFYKTGSPEGLLYGELRAQTPPRSGTSSAQWVNLCSTPLDQICPT